jgi:hypothetical protein
MSVTPIPRTAPAPRVSDADHGAASVAQVSDVLDKIGQDLVQIVGSLMIEADPAAVPRRCPALQRLWKLFADRLWPTRQASGIGAVE